jgi:hypothetical protein
VTKYDSAKLEEINGSRSAVDAAGIATSSNWRPLWLAGAALIFALVGVALFLERFVAHRLPALTEAALDAAEKRWRDAGPKSYDLDLEIGGAEPGPVHVEVRNGEVVAMQRDGETPAQRRVWDVWAIPGQFATLERELELAADPAGQMGASAETRLSIQCEFDPQFGYPRRYHRLVYGGGPEVYWRTTKFEVK